ncbi:MAG: hypothetical protein ACD_51C00061G0003 [uncultured bacterium]|nr:MAG: hypothetical protein ACD_51C00061G0003 [uncultured bacterium]OGJ47774.1 MAG: hypothetical protein A2244_03975 [Candidatus Peregrinibacteria bacterium RIFOXYA2_FULL_41_18]OGJ49083.1 MAG: hypothetical protein A2344_05885 [Candidatus Peregrinibacteria bacterium RIFOXYB12_FULL_41_12]OGJ52917.1 MAG: hypothetical protein A2336_04910 [Candidatus Peregrinibacteria bacterium RIFOXYB2_FULL_41_88]OGJ53544.1 MAG: hypothetical protein A2448_04485 [Candidatus Peregrinibacteria bacterium RIFOXYC2_FULL
MSKLFFAQNRLLFKDPEQNPARNDSVDSMSSGVSDHAVSVVDSPELAELRAKIEDQQSRIDELQSRSAMDMVGSDVERVHAYIDDAADRAVDSLKSAFGKGYESAKSYVVGSAEEAMSAAEKALQQARDAADAQLAELYSEYTATVERVQVAVKDGWGDLIEAGVVTLEEINNVESWTTKQVLAVAQQAVTVGAQIKTLPDVFWTAVDNVQSLTSQEAKVLLQCVKTLGGNVDTFVDTLVKQGGDMIAVALNEVKDDTQRVVDVVGIALQDGSATFYKALDTVVGLRMEVGDVVGSLLEQGKMKVSDVARLVVEKKNYAVDAVNALMNSGVQKIDAFARIVAQDARQLEATVAVLVESGEQAVNKFVESALVVGKTAGLAVLAALASAGYGVNETIRSVVSRGRVTVENLAWMVSYNVDYCKAVVDGTYNAGVDKFNEMCAAVMANKDSALAWLDGVEAAGVEQLNALAQYLGENKDEAVAMCSYAIAEGQQSFNRVMDTLVGAGLEVNDLVGGLVDRGEVELNAVLVWAGDNVEKTQVVVGAIIDAGDQKVEQLLAIVGEQKDKVERVASAAVALGDKYAAEIAIGAFVLMNIRTVLVVGALAAAGYGINKVFTAALDAGRVQAGRLVEFVSVQSEYAASLAEASYAVGVQKFNEVTDAAMQEGEVALAWFNTVKESGQEKVAVLAKNLQQKQQELAVLAGQAMDQGEEAFYNTVDTLAGAGLEVKDVMVALVDKADTKIDQLVAVCAAKKDYMVGLASATAVATRERASQIIVAVNAEVQAKEAFVKATINAGQDVLVANYEAAQAVGINLGRRAERKYNAAKKDIADEQRRLEERGRKARVSDANGPATDVDL